MANAIAYTKMKEYDYETIFSNEIEFTLDSKIEVSLGLIVNLNNKKCLTIKEFILKWEEIEKSDEDDDTTTVENVESIIKEGIIYNLQGIKVLKPIRGNIYT